MNSSNESKKIVSDRSFETQKFIQFLKEDKHENIDAFFHTANHTFQDIEFEGKRIVDIGSGKGLMSIYTSLYGAKEVVSLEPELHGATNKALEIQRDRVKKLNINNIKILNQDFNLWEYNDEPFDIVMSFASINHLHESPYHALHHEETRQIYIDIAKKIRELLCLNGVAMITDSCRYGLFHWLKYIGINRPWTPTKRTSINFRIHQNPGVWKDIFVNAGFSEVRIKYPLPYKLRKVKKFIENPIANFLLEARFILYCYR